MQGEQSAGDEGPHVLPGQTLDNHKDEADDFEFPWICPPTGRAIAPPNSYRAMRFRIPVRNRRPVPSF